MNAHRCFTAEMLQVLLAPERWRIISSACPAEAATLDMPRHAQWMHGHAHSHLFPELLLALHGEDVHGVRGHVYPSTPGTLFHFDINEFHDSGCPPWADKVVYLWFGILPDIATMTPLTLARGANIFDQAQTVRLTAHEVGQTLQVIHALSKSELPAPYRRMRLLTAVATLVAAMLEYNWLDTPPPPSETRQEQIIRGIQRYLRETGGNGATLNSLAFLTGYSPCYFARIFHHHTGRTVHQYINDCRWERIELMRQHHEPQKRISQALGFACESSFSRWLRQQREEKGQP